MSCHRFFSDKALENSDTSKKEKALVDTISNFVNTIVQTSMSKLELEKTSCHPSPSWGRAVAGLGGVLLPLSLSTATLLSHFRPKTGNSADKDQTRFWPLLQGR